MLHNSSGYYIFCFLEAMTLKGILKPEAGVGLSPLPGNKELTEGILGGLLS